MTMALTDRERELIDLLMEDATISVNDMSSSLKVSPVTVRATLNSLADKGFIVRTWGGAFPAFHPEILERQRCRVEEKNRIAKAAAGLIRDGDTVMIEAGTTTALIVKYLFGKRDIFLVSNSTLVIPFARANPSLHLTLIGGQFRPGSESMVGPAALQELERFHVNTAFVGTDGFSRESGLTTHLVEGAEIVKKMAERAEQTVLVADSAKYGKTGFVRVLALDRVSRIICDSGLDAAAREALRECGPRLDIV